MRTVRIVGVGTTIFPRKARASSAGTITGRGHGGELGFQELPSVDSRKLDLGRGETWWEVFESEREREELVNITCVANRAVLVCGDVLLEIHPAHLLQPE